MNHDVHWRPGVALDGSETFLPRTVVYDLKGGFGSLRKINALYDASQEEAPAHLWSVTRPSLFDSSRWPLSSIPDRPPNMPPPTPGKDLRKYTNRHR